MLNSFFLKKDKLFIGLTAGFVFLTFIQGLITQYTRINEIDLLDDLILLILFITAVVYAFINNLYINKKYLFIFIFPFVFLIYLLISGVINHIPLIIVAVSFRDYFQYILFFLFLIVFFNKYMFELIHKFILLISVLLILFAVGQIIATKISNTFYPDLISGTFGRSGAHILSSVLIFFIGYYLSKILINRKIKIMEILHFLSLIVLLIIISFRTLLLLSPVIIFLFIFITRVYKKKYFYIITAAFTLIVIVFWFIIKYTDINIFNIRGLIEQQTSPDFGGRIFQFKYLFSNILDNPIKMFFGDGPGTFFSKTCRFFNYERWIWVKENIVKGYIQYVISLAEIGLIGIISIIVFYISIIRQFRKDLIQRIPNKEKIIISATIFFIISYLFSGVGGNVFEWQETNMILWFYIAYCCKLGNKERLLD